MRYLLCLLLAPAVLAVQCDEARVFLPTNNPAEAVDVSGDRAIVGLPSGADPARVAILEHDGTRWSTVAEIPGPSGTSTAFGRSVAIDGDLAVVSDIFYDQSAQDSGGVWVLEPVGGNWMITGFLPSQLGDVNDNFGASLGVQEVLPMGGRIMVGAPNAGNNDIGLVWVYERTNGAWVQVETLMARSPASLDRFGAALDLDGDQCAVGMGSGRGVSLFHRMGTAWQPLAEFDDPFPNVGSTFGRDVALHQDWLAVAEPHTVGRVHVYERGWLGWLPYQTILPSSSGIGFGSQVEVFGDRLLVGFYGAEHWGQVLVGRGDVYEFDGALWSAVGQLVPSDGRLGHQTGLTGAALGATRALLTRMDSTGASLLSFENPESCTGASVGVSFCPATVPNSSGNLGQLDALGSDRIASDQFVLHATNLPAGKACIAAAALNAAPPFVPPGSQGTTCLGSLVRLPGLMTTDAQGTARFPVDVVAQGVLVGETWHFQAWHRDLNPGGTSNFSGGVEVLFQ